MAFSHPFNSAETTSLDEQIFSKERSSTIFDFLKEGNFPEANWNLSGAFRFDYSLRQFLDYFAFLMKGYLSLGNVSGVPACLWGLDWFKVRPLVSLSSFRENLEAYSKKGAGVSVCLDNPFITDAMLSDEVGNVILQETFSRDRVRRNSVTVASDKLRDHIRKLFPKLKVNAGVNRLVTDQGKRTLSTYEKLAEHYNCVAIHPADNSKWDMLEGLKDKNKFEITVNDTCLRTCPVRRDHMYALSRIRENPYSAEFLKQRYKLLEIAGCEGVEVKPLVQKRSLLLTRQEMQTLYDMGFRNFRIQSESLRNEISYAWELCRNLLGFDRPEISEKTSVVAVSFLAKINRNKTGLTTGLKSYSSVSYE